jgi:hypothetical protein
LRSFILPGGTAMAAHMHVCRTVARRAERLVVELATMESVNPEAVKYLNRLSDWFFVAGRIANNDGKDDVLVGSGREPLTSGGPASGRTGTREGRSPGPKGGREPLTGGRPASTKERRREVAGKRFPASRRKQVLKISN